METHNIICFERMTKEFDTIFDYTLPKGPKLKLLNTTIIQSEHGIRIDQTNDTTNNIIQEYRVTKTKE